ncbi:ABC transporter substrate-binding protein [Roseospirillum parvum]|nr:ABC transporter substrate-binding protein [Roseospirillum parvum]
MVPFARLLMLLCLGLALAGCERVEPVRLAALMPLGGPAASVGQSLREGLELAVDEINQRGGLNARPIELTVVDSTAAPGGLEAAYHEVVATDPLLIIAGTSNVAVALKPLAEADRRLLFGLVATAPALTENATWSYRYWPLAAAEVPAMLAGLPPDENLSLGVAFLDDAYGRSVAEGLAEHVRRRGGRGLMIPFALTTTDYSDLAQTLGDTDAVAIVAFDAHIRAVLEALEAANYRGRRLASSSGALPAMFDHPAAEGLYVAAPAIYNPSFLVSEQTRQTYEARTGKPFDQYAANGVDFIRLLDGLLVDREVSAVSLKARLADGFAYAGLFGNVSLSAGGHDIEFPLLAARVEGGRLVYR